MNVSTVGRRRRNPVLDLRNECDSPKKVTVYSFPYYRHERVLYRIDGCSNAYVDRVVGLFLREGYRKHWVGNQCNLMKKGKEVM